MAVHLTEEEQLEELKRFWQQWGKLIIVSVCVALVAYFGYVAWKDQQYKQGVASSGLYEELTTLLEKSQDQLSEDEQATARHLAEQLMNEFGSNLYGHQAGLHLASMLMQEAKPDQAAEKLKWVIAQSPARGIELIARQRLALVLTDLGNYSEALGTLDAVSDPAEFAARYHETRGDIFVAQGKPLAAKTAYEKALDNLLDQQQRKKPLIEMKLNDLVVAQPAAAETDVVEESSSESEQAEAVQSEDEEPTADSSVAADNQGN